MNKNPCVIRSCSVSFRALASVALLVLGCVACATVEKAPVDARLVEAQKAFDEGERLEQAGQYAQAAPFLERALELRESVYGEMHPDVAKCIHLRGVVYRRQGDYTRAEQLLQRALAIQESTLGKSHPDVASSLSSLATLYRIQGRFDPAEQLYERAILIQEAALGKNHPHVARSLNSLANLYSIQRNYERSRPLYERAIAIQEAALGKNHVLVAQSINNLANTYSNEGDYGRARPLFEYSLAIQEAALGKNHPDIAPALNSLANLYDALGHYTRAESYYERALTLFEASLGKSHPNVATVLNNLADIYVAQGQYARAEPLYARTLSIWEAALGKSHPDLTLSLNNLAILYSKQGDYARARPLYERSLAITEEAFGKTHADVAISLNNLANLDWSQGNRDEARRLYESVIAIREEALGRKHPLVATSLHNLAITYEHQGNVDAARALYERALAIREEVLGKKHPDVSFSLQHLARLALKEGDYARAGLLYERALAILEEVLVENHPDIVTTLHNLAHLRLVQQRLPEALTLLERAFTLSEQHLRQEAYGFSEARLTRVLSLLRVDEERLYALVRAYPGNARIRSLALSAALLRKGRSAEEIAETSRLIYRGLGEADREVFERLRALRAQYASLAFVGSGTAVSADSLQRLKELTEQGDALEADLARRSGPLRALVARHSSEELLGSVAAALPGDGALVEFIAYEDRPLVSQPDSPSSRSPAELRYLALVLFADGSTRALDLGPAAPIDQASLRLHAALASSDKSYQSKARAFHARVFQPLMPLLGNARQIFLSPDSQLSLVPFAALHDGRQFLVDRFDITYVTSGKDLLRRSADVSPARSVVILADPDFDSSQDTSQLVAAGGLSRTERSASLDRFFSAIRSESVDQPWQPLPGTRKEADAIQRLLPEARTLMGRDATKDALLSLATPGVLHIATHGFFLEDAKAQMADANAQAATRAPGSFGAVGEGQPLSLSDDPLLRSGLVLAGARSSSARSNAYRRQDSLVTALELAGLDLWGTQLVVLSACDTGRGVVKLGQGVYGLRRALVVAGAQTLVTSLWKVNDETTHQLMESYYRNLLAGQGRGAALRAAMKALRQKQPHPHFWAPFIAIGQDKPLQGLVPSTGARSTP